MRPTIQMTLSLLFPLLLTVSVEAAPQIPVGVAGSDSVTTSDAEVEESILTLHQLSASGQLRVDDLIGVGNLMRGWCEGPLFPPQDELGTRERLRLATEGLTERARNGWATKLEVYEMQMAYLDALVDRAVGWLQVQARERGASREQYQQVSDTLMAQARFFSQYMAPDAQSYRARWSQVLDSMISRAVAHEAGLDELRLAIIEERLQRSIYFLRVHAQKRGATRAQYQDFVQLMTQRARLLAGVSPEGIE